MSNSAITKRKLRSSTSRSLISGIGAAALAFAAAKFVLAWFGVTPPSPFNPTANLPNFMSSHFSWVGMQGLYARAIIERPAIPGAPTLRIVTIPAAKRHMIAASVSGLDTNHSYRIAVWVRSEAGANFEIEAGDHASNHASYGVGLFNLTSHAAGGTAAAKPGIMLEPNGWQKTWLELPTATGELFFALYVLKGGNNRFVGDGKMGIILGGFAMEKIS